MTTDEEPPPKPRKYNGRSYRSTLEARWAVFFDAAGIPFAYEPEGYNIGGAGYLPDFYLPEPATWVEVKGSPARLDFGRMMAAAQNLPRQPPYQAPGPALMLLGDLPEVPAFSCDWGTAGFPHDWGFTGIAPGPVIGPGPQARYITEPSIWRWGFGRYHLDKCPRPLLTMGERLSMLWLTEGDSRWVMGGRCWAPEKELLTPHRFRRGPVSGPDPADWAAEWNLPEARCDDRILRAYQVARAYRYERGQVS